MGVKEFFGRLFKIGSSHGTGGGLTEGDLKQNGTRMMCVECSSSFYFEPGEQKFYKMRGLTPPKRCPACRGKRKHQRRR